MLFDTELLFLARNLKYSLHGTNSQKGVYQMKNLFYRTVLGCLMAIPAHAMMNSELSIGMQDNTKFTLSFDNSNYSTPSTTYNVTNITPGSHHVRMTRAPVITNNAYGLPRLLFDGWVNFPENSRLTAYANSFMQLNVVSIVPLAQQQQQVVYVDPNVNYGNGYNNGYNNGSNNGNGNYYGNNYGNGCGNSSGYTNNNYGQNNYAYPVYGMPAADFQTLKAAVADKAFDSSKLTLAEQAAGANNLSAQQVFELVQLMDFESSKLALAKYAYGHTADKNNYYVVSNAFDFESSITDLSTYINSYHA
jgi:hypothetical protein